MARTVISGGTILTPHPALHDHSLVIEGGRIHDLAPGVPPTSADDVFIDASGCWVIPGLIDIHTHGGGGHDTMDATPEALAGMARFLATHGITSYLPTTVSASREAIHAAVDNVARCPQPSDGARHLGVHLEGPYLDPDHSGAQPPRHLRAPDPEEYRPWLIGGVVRLITIAPELDGALRLIEEGTRHGVGFAVGHSGATYEEVVTAADLGLRQATHTFNGMAPLHHRRPGVVGAVLADSRIAAQLIADGVHVHPVVSDLLLRIKGWQGTILVSDSIRAAGLGDGVYELGGQEIYLRDGVPRTVSGSLAGSTLTLDSAVRNLATFTNLPLADCIAAATVSPAAVMGWPGKGQLVPGADADVVVLDDKLTVLLTLVEGRIVYRRERKETTR